MRIINYFVLRSPILNRILIWIHFWEVNLSKLRPVNIKLLIHEDVYFSSTIVLNILIPIPPSSRKFLTFTVSHNAICKLIFRQHGRLCIKLALNF